MAYIWNTQQTLDPVVARLRGDTRRALIDGRVWSTPRIADHLAPAWGGDLPPVEWLSAALAGEPLLWRLPDGRWLHTGAVTWERTFTTAMAGVHRGIVPIDVDCATALRSFGGWTRIPVRRRDWRGIAEVVAGRGRRLLVLPEEMLPTGMPLLALVPGPEGLLLHGVDVDEIATTLLRRRIAQACPSSAAPGDGGRSAAWNLADEPGAHDTPPRPWTVADVELVALAGDPALRRSATSPLSKVLRTRPDDRVARAG